jgi:valine--pyruvate aminotransferase
MDSDPERIWFSHVGRKLTAASGILELMDDLGHAMTERPEILMLGGGNPAHVPPVQALWRARAAELLAAGEDFDRLLANYDPPQGNPRFLRALAALFARTYGWPVEACHVAVTNGAQAAFFCLLNLLAGQGPGRRRKVLLPLAPEYIGYADQTLEEDVFVSCRPLITWPDGPHTRRFKYHIDFAAVESVLAAEDVAAIVVSRPTNPTGNVVSDDEVRRLSDLAARHGALLVLDNAYGQPFPGITFTPAEPLWAPHHVLTFSLSKLGLPGTRTGLVLGPPAIIRALGAMTAIVGLANGNLGQQLVLPLVESGEILELGPRWLRPFYEERSRAAQAWLHEFLEPTGADWALHVSEGAFFHWLWFRDLPIATSALYQRLKARDVLVVPGDFFFFGLRDDWPHRHECLRLSFAQDPHCVQEALRRLGDEVTALYHGWPNTV